MAKRPAAILFGTFRDVTLATLLTIAICEIGIRVVGLDPGKRLITMDIAPTEVAGDTFWPMPARYDPDGDGLRGTAIPGPTTDTNAPTAVLLGDSIFFGVQIPDEARLAALLGKRMHVHDTSVPGYATTQMRIALQQRLAKTRPNAVVMSFFHNDTAVWAKSGEGVRRACLAFRVPLPAVGAARLDADHGWWLYRNSAVFRAVSGPWVHVDRACQARGERAVLTETAKIITLSQEAGARVLIVLLADTNLPWPEALKRRPQMKLYDEVAKLARSHGAMVIDALPDLAKAPLEDVALDTTGHLKPRGHEILAASIAKALGVLAPE